MNKFIALCLIALAPLVSCGNFAIFQTYEAPATPVVSFNIVTDGGAACNGDVQTQTRTTSISSGTGNLSVTVDTFSAGDVGKTIAVPGAGNSGGTLFVEIKAVTDAQNIVLVDNAGTTLSGVSTALTWGTDDAQAFMDFNTWALANQGNAQVQLTIPNGSDCWFGHPVNSTVPQLLNGWASGINNLLVIGDGARISSESGFGFQLGGFGICQAGIADAAGCSARIQSVSAGATQVTLTAASLAAGYISRFSAGAWLMVGGMNPQALDGSPYGYPPNLVYFEWRQIVSVDTMTGVITFADPLINSYEDTWPLYNEGSAFEADPGGPATIYAIGNTWNTRVEYRGLTISQDGQTYAQGRYVTYRDVIFTGGHGGIPTQNVQWSAINTDMSGMNLETDKLVGTMEMDGVTISQIVFQSTSTDLFIMRNSTVTLRLDGTPKRAEISDSTLALFGPGATAYGSSTTTICTNCVITEFNFNGGIFQNNVVDYSMASGVISFPNTAASGPDPYQRWATPGANIFWSGDDLTQGLFQAQNITQDATDTFIQTSEAGGFPTSPGCCTFRSHPAPQFTCDNCTGDPAIVAASVQAGATPLDPLGSYSSRTFTPTSAEGNLGTLYARGHIVSLTINVTQEYTGAGAAVLNPTAQFTLPTIKADGTVFDWLPVIDLNTPGERIITPSGATCNGSPGGCGADKNLTVPEAVWITDKIVPYMGSTFTGGTAPTFAITIRTDPGVIVNYLLNRDLDPASNDNTPAFLNQAA